MYPEKKGGSHKMARPQQNWGLLTLLTRWASIWTMPNTASPKSEPPCGRAVYTLFLGHPPQKTAPPGEGGGQFPREVTRWQDDHFDLVQNSGNSIANSNGVTTVLHQVKMIIYCSLVPSHWFVLMGPLLPRCINFNPNMGKQLHPL